MTEEREIADDEDIYSDVLAIQDVDFDKFQQEVQKLKHEKALLIKSLETLQKTNEKLQNEFKELESKYNTVNYTLSALFKTAQAEISRKDRTIRTLRKEKDDLLFRRSSSGRASSRLRRSATPRKPRTPSKPIVSPRKLKTPVKRRTTTSRSKSPVQVAGDLLGQGNETDTIKTFLKNVDKTPPENKNEGEQPFKKVDVKISYAKDDVEEEGISDQTVTYIPPTIQGPVTMYSKRLYKKLHGVSPQKMPPPTDISNVTRSLTDSKVSPPKADKIMPVTRVVDDSGQRNCTNPLDRIASTDKLKSNRARKDLLSPSDKTSPKTSPNQEREKPNECKTSRLTSKLRLETQEFIKLGSSVKSCQISSPKGVIIDLRNLPKEDGNVPDLIVKEILNNAYGMIPGAMTKNLKSGDMRDSSGKNNEISIKEVIDNQPSPHNERNHFKDDIHAASSHQTPRASIRGRPRGNNSVNKPVIAPVTFGKLVPHEPPKGLAKTLCVGNQEESQKRKSDSLEPTGSVSPSTEQNPVVDALKNEKTTKLFDSLFGESPLKPDKPILDRTSPSPTSPLIFPDSPSLDSDNPDDLVIDISACSGSEQKDELEEVKINKPSQNVKEVNCKTSNKSVHDDLNLVVNASNESSKLDNKFLNPQSKFDSKLASSGFGLPDLSECYSLDNDVQSINKSIIINNELHNIKLDVPLPSQKLSTFVEPETKTREVTLCAKEDISTPPRFFPSPPQLSIVSGLTNSENSIVIVGDTMDLVSKLACTNVRDISPIRTPDKRKDIVTTEMESAKPGLDISQGPREIMTDSSDHPFSKSFHSNDSIKNIMQILTVSKIEGAQTSHNLGSIDSKKDFTERVATPPSTDHVVEKLNTQNKLPTLDHEKLKIVQPENEFKRKGTVRRRRTSNSKIENQIPTTKSNKENDESIRLKSNLSVDINIKKIGGDDLQETFDQAMVSNIRHDKKEDPNFKLISEAKEEIHFDPKQNEVDQTVQRLTKQHLTSKLKQPLNPQVTKGIGSKSNEDKSNSETMSSNVVSISTKQYHLKQIENNTDIKQNSQENASVLEVDTKKPGGLTPEVEHPILIEQSKKPLTPERLISKTETETKAITHERKSFFEEMGEKKIQKTLNNLTSFLAKIINTPNQEINPSKQNENLSQQEVNINTPKTVEIPPIKSQKVTPGKSTLPEAKAAVRKLTIKSSKLDIGDAVFKRSSSIKLLAKPLPRVKSERKTAAESLYRSDYGQKQELNTSKELEEMPHIAKINQRVRKSSYQGNKEQSSLNMHPLNDKTTAVKRKKDNVASDQTTNLPNASSTPVVRKRNVRSKISPKVAPKKRPVGVDKDDKTSQSPINKQTRSKSKTQSNPNVNNPNHECSVDTVRRHSSPIPKTKLQHQCRKSQSVSPERRSSHSKSSPSCSPSPLQKTKPHHTRRSQSKSPGRRKSAHSLERVPSRSPSTLQKNKTHQHSSRSESLSPERRRSSNTLKRVPSTSPSPLRKSKPQRHSRRSPSLSPSQRKSSNILKKVPSRSPSPLQPNKPQQHSSRSQSLSPGGRRGSIITKGVPSRSPSPLQANKSQRYSRRSQSLSPVPRSPSPFPLQKTKPQRHCRESQSLSPVPRRSPSPLQKTKLHRYSRRSLSLSPVRRRSSKTLKRVPSRSPSPLQQTKLQRHSRRSQSLSPGRRSSKTSKSVPSRSSLQQNNTQRHSRRSESRSPVRRRNFNISKRVPSTSPSPLHKTKFQRHSRRSQSLSPSQRRRSQNDIKETRDEISIARNSTQLRNNSRYRENLSNISKHNLGKYPSISPERKYRSKSNHLKKSRESDSPERTIGRSYHQSRRMHNRTPDEEYRYNSRKRMKSPHYRSNLRHNRERSQSPEYKRYRFQNARDRSRNQYERSRSRTPPHSDRKRFSTYQTSDKLQVLESSSKIAKRRLSVSEENVESETAGGDRQNKSSRQSSDECSKNIILEMRRELDLLKEKWRKSNEQSQEKEKDHEQKDNIQSSDGKKDVRSRSRSPQQSRRVNPSSRTSQPEVVRDSGSQARNSSNLRSRDGPSMVSSQQQNAPIVKHTDNSTTVNENVPTLHKRIIKRKTIILGDSDVNVVSAIKIKDKSSPG